MPWLEQNGLKINYEICGAGSGAPAVVMHHGMAQWGEDWKSAGWLDVFSGMQTLVFDAIGHGRSSKPGELDPYLVERRADTVLALADAAGFDKFTFFGFSMGGRVGFELASKAPGRLDSLIVGGMHGLRGNIDRRNLERRIAVLRSPRWRMVERAIGARQDDGRGNEAQALALSTEASLEWNGVEADLPGIAVQTLIFCGQRDSLLEYARRTAALVPRSTFVELPAASHAASFYTSQEAKEAVRKFLAAARTE